MPALGAEVESATLVEWRVKPGDAVKRGDIVAEVETDKGVIEIESFETGVVSEILVGPGTKVPVGAVLARIRVEGEAPARVRVSPAAKAAAEKLGLDAMQLKGTGPEGSVTREDVEKAAVPKDPAAAMRRAIGAAMSKSKREIPHYYLAARVDMGPAMAWLAAENASRPIADRLLPAALIVKAVARAAAEVPELNGFWIDGSFRPGSGVHVGVAVSLKGGGLVAPAIHDADRLRVGEVMSRLADLVTRARTGSLKGSEMSDPTITVTSLGDSNVEEVFGVIIPPQVAILGFGAVVERPWVVEGRVVPRPVVTVSLSADHRASDGRRGAAFLAALDRRLQKPGEL